MLQKADNTSSASNGLDYFSSEKVLHPVSSIFNVEQSLKENGLDSGDYITLADVRNLCNQPLKAEAHAFVSSYEGDVPGGETARWEGMPWKIPEKLYPWENSRSHPLAGIEDLSFIDAKLVARDSNHKLPLEQVPSGSMVPILVTDGLLFKTEMTEPKYASFGDPFITVSKFRWASHIEERAQEYVNTHFGQNNFLAVHWRRGFAVTLISMEDVVGMLRNATTEIHQPGTPLPDVYVASNQFNAGDKGQLEQMLGSGQRVYSLMLEPPQEVDLNTISHIEMAVCTRARAFMMTPGSTWSMNVRAFRGDFAQGTTLTSIRQEAAAASKASASAASKASAAAATRMADA